MLPVARVDIEQDISCFIYYEILKHTADFPHPASSVVSCICSAGNSISRLAVFV